MILAKISYYTAQCVKSLCICPMEFLGCACPKVPERSSAEFIPNHSAAIHYWPTFFQFLPSDEVTSEKLASELKLAASEERFENESWHVRRNGSRFWGHVVITALRDYNG